MTKLITLLIAIVVVYCSYQLYLYWGRVKTGAETRQVTTSQINPDSLPGMPPQLEKAFQTARAQGPAVMGKWLNVFGQQVQDPRRAWIKLDYCVAIARDNPAEARRIFAEVKERTAPTSPVWPRVKELEKSFE
jgi:hypothetical protein